MKSVKIIFLLLISLFIINSELLANSDSDTEKKDPFHRYFIGSSAFILFNVVPNQSNPPDFFQLNFGYRLTKKDVISVEAITWKYNEPLGIPLWDTGDAYPGYVREFGLGVAYQRYLWKGLYTALHALPLYQMYMDDDDKKIQNGFHLFCTLRLGYHFSFFNDRFFIEPGIAVTFSPINTNVPGGFKRIENKWPKYNFEPGFHIGYKFSI